MSKHVLIVPDGAADLQRIGGRSPLEIAATPGLDFLAREGVCGRMQTLYDDLPRESLVAQLGLLGWDPRIHYPHGRSSFELLASGNAEMQDGDLAFRANLVRMEGRVLASYNAGLICSEQSAPLVERIDRTLRSEFPDFELYHNQDFRNTLVVRRAGIDPRSLSCPEPHENEGGELKNGGPVSGRDEAARQLAGRLNRYVSRAAELLGAHRNGANMLWPWSPSTPAHLPRFTEVSGFNGRVAVVGFMDFLKGLARAGNLEFFQRGNGRPDTDYAAKGSQVVALLAAGYDLVVCHVNAPDEASHLGDLDLKIHSLEQIDRHIVQPVVEYFLAHPDELGGVMAVPDHYTNHSAECRRLARAQAHSLHPVPFAIWNGREVDDARHFGEEEARRGRYGEHPVGHLACLGLLGISSMPAGPGFAGPFSA